MLKRGVFYRKTVQIKILSKIFIKRRIFHLQLTKYLIEYILRDKEVFLQKEVRFYTNTNADCE